MGMNDFHWRSAVFSRARNLALLIAPGVMNSWVGSMRDGDLFQIGGKIFRSAGVCRHSAVLHGDVMKVSTIDGQDAGVMICSEGQRIEKLDIIGHSDVVRFLKGTQPAFIRDVGAVAREMYGDKK